MPVAALVDAFSTLGDSIGQTRRVLADAHEPPAEIDLTVVHLNLYDEAAR